MSLSLGYLTAGSAKEAKELALGLLEQGLVACVNVLPQGQSYFVWEEEIVEEKEFVLLLKTRTKNEEKIIRYIKQHHSYECPCILFFTLENGSKDFLEWVELSTKF